MKGFVVYQTYKIEGNKAYVYLFGRLENNESFLSIHEFKPYFFIKKEDLSKAKELLKLDYQETDFKNFKDELMVKVILKIPKELPEAKRVFVENGINCYEADIKITTRFLIDNKICSSLDIEGEYTKEKDIHVDRVYKNPKIKPVEYFPNLKILSIDIETDSNAKDLWSISLACQDYEKVLIKKQGKFEKAECFNDEKSLLERFNDLVKKIDPDVIVGWNVIEFDFKVLRELYKKNNVDFSFGRNHWENKLRITDSFFISSTADVIGRVILDGIHLLKDAFIKLPDYTLNTASGYFLDHGKIFTGPERWEDIRKAYEEDPQLLIDYNLLDSKLVLGILDKSKVMDLAIRRSMITGMTLDRVSSSIASFDMLYLKELKNIKRVAPSSIGGDVEERIKGGYVRESYPGIYDNILVLDFKSLYPSLIRTFNIDPLTHCECEGDVIEAPNKACFRKEIGLLPKILEELWEKRDKAKKDKDKNRSNAIKLIMNSFFGILANPNCRFYSFEIANAITHFGQFVIKLAAQKVEEKGYKVIYGDTDSIFVNCNIKDYEEAKKKGDELEKYLNEFFMQYVKEKYGMKSYLFLEFEKVYKKFLMPRVRGSSEGAKKRYAGLIQQTVSGETVGSEAVSSETVGSEAVSSETVGSEAVSSETVGSEAVSGETVGSEAVSGKTVDSIQFVGMEFVRSDWTDLAKEFQMKLFELIFTDQQVDQYITDFIKDLKAGKMDELLVYRKSIRKPVSEYTKTTPPHIKAARILGMEGVGKISYVITVNGPEPVKKLSSNIDYQHYIDKQIKPIADSVLEFFDKDFDDVIKGKQKSLFEF